MQDLQITNHQVTTAFAAEIVKKYKQFRSKMIKAKKTNGMLPAGTPDMPLFLAYNKTAIHNLLKKPGCVALRMYPAINDDNQLTLVIVGVDATGENLLDAKNATSTTESKVTSKSTSVTLLDEGQASPPYPPPSNGF